MIDILMRRRLETYNNTMRVCIWHNGAHEETIDVAGSFLSDSRAPTSSQP